MGDEDKTDYTNIVTNVVLPFDPRRTKLLMGSLEYIAAEVVVAKVVRKIIKADTKGWLELAYVHALSLPFMGGTAAFFERNAGYNGTDNEGKKLTFTTQLMDGARVYPQYWLPSTLLSRFRKGSTLHGSI